MQDLFGATLPPPKSRARRPAATAPALTPTTVVLSLGAGVQSTTLLLLSLAGDLPLPDLVVFADTGWEPQSVYDHLGRLETRMAAAGVPFLRVSAGDLRRDTLEAARGERARVSTMPLHIRRDGVDGLLWRQCTRDYKVRPIRRAVRQFQQRVGAKASTLWMGISLDEIERMRQSEVANLVNAYPLVERRWSRQDCLAWLAARGETTPPKSACIGCPYRSQAGWRSLPPAEFADAVDFDRQIRHLPIVQGDAYLHRQRIPLDRVDLLDQVGGQLELDLFGTDCSGSCGV